MADETHTSALPVVPDPPLPGGAFWKTASGRVLLWAFNILVITITFIAVSWIAAKSGIPVPISQPNIEPAPVIVEQPAPPQAVESPTQFYCGRLETLADAQTTRPWPVKKLTWTVKVSEYRGNLSVFQLKEAFTVAWAAWAARIDIEPVFTENESSALIVSRFGDIDGSGRVLAWSELADGTNTPKHQLYDAGEKWELSAVPQQIDLVRVVAHEVGHVLGLFHDDPESKTLMAPMYDRNIRFPTDRDAKRLLAMGYRERVAPPGSGPVIPPLNISIDAKQIVDALEKAGYKVEKK